MDWKQWVLAVGCVVVFHVAWERLLSEIRAAKAEARILRKELELLSSRLLHHQPREVGDAQLEYTEEEVRLGEAMLTARRESAAK